MSASGFGQLMSALHRVRLLGSCIIGHVRRLEHMLATLLEYVYMNALGGHAPS